VPGAPTLNVPTAGDGSVGLSWSAPASNGGATVSDYAIYRSTTAGAETQLATTGSGTILTYTDTAVSNGTTYFYKVAAINGVGTGALSNERSATPSAPATPDFTLAVTPASRSVPRGSATTFTVTVTAANGFTGVVNFSSTISPSGNGITRSFNPTGVSLGAVTSGQTTFTVGTAKKTQKRSYTITITGTGGGQVHSTTVTVTVT
jgi:fibronectin type 3 domain-containing protein